MDGQIIRREQFRSSSRSNNCESF